MWHLFLHCTVATDIWSMCIKEAYERWCSWRAGKSIKKIWSMMPGAFFWCIWNERNHRCFDGISTPNHTLD